MSSTTATFIVLGLYALAFIPFVALIRKPALSVAIAGIAAVLALAFSVYHSGMLSNEIPERPALIEEISSADSQGRQCAEAIELAERAGIIRDRSQPGRLVVQETRWKQLPQLARDALTQCVRFQGPADKREEALEIVF